MCSRMMLQQQAATMTVSEFEQTKWQSGMRIAIGNLSAEVFSVNFETREIAFEDRYGVVWINSEYVTLKVNDE